MPAKYDAVVIGRGHNGLTCACSLAKAGINVLVLEEYHSIGGMTSREELSLPGFMCKVGWGIGIPRCSGLFQGIANEEPVGE